MPSELIRFPGDLITADLWNRMLELIDQTNARIDANEAIVVPNVVGDLFVPARDAIARAQLGFDAVLDVDGTRVSTDSAAIAQRVVLTQTPSPETRVPRGSRVTLLITAPPQADVNKKAPAIAAVKSGTGGLAQVGQPLDVIGERFTQTADDRLRVIIRGTELGSDQFVVQGETAIHIVRVPPFEGAPAAGTTKDIQITVMNQQGKGTFTAPFFEPELPIARPSIANVHFLDPVTISLRGTDLVQTGHTTAVTMGGQEVRAVPQSDGSLAIPLPGAIAAVWQALPPAVFKLLLTLDRNDLFVVNIVTNPFVFVGGNDLPLAARPDVARAGGVAGSADEFIGRTITTTMKLFLTMSADRATRAQSGVVKVSGTQVTLTDFQGKTIFSVDVSKPPIEDFTIVVKVGDKSTAFVARFGVIPDPIIRDLPRDGGFIREIGEGGRVFKPR